MTLLKVIDAELARHLAAADDAYARGEARYWNTDEFRDEAR